MSLHDQLDKAQAEYNSWPEWMRDAARWVSPSRLEPGDAGMTDNKQWHPATEPPTEPGWYECLYHDDEGEFGPIPLMWDGEGWYHEGREEARAAFGEPGDLWREETQG